MSLSATHNVPLNEARIRRAPTKVGIFLHSTQEDLVYRCNRLEALDPLAEVLQSLLHLEVEVKRLVDLIAHCCGCCVN